MTISQSLASQIERAGDQYIRIIVELKDTACVSKHQTPKKVSQQLKECAESQLPVCRVIEDLISNEFARAMKRLWIINAIALEAKPQAIEVIAQHPDVKNIYSDCNVRIQDTSSSATEVGTWPHIEFCKIPEVWKMGYRGQGVRVLVTDTGINLNHIELFRAMGGFPPLHRGYWSEWDSDGNEVFSSPRDIEGHGTHVSGTIVGRNVRYLIGVAPEAILACAQIFLSRYGTTAQAIAGLQWGLEQEFRVVNGSWAFIRPEPYTPVPEDAWRVLIPAINALIVAEIIPVFAIGNDGPGTHGGPANNPKCVGVGALNRDGIIATFSSGAIVDFSEYEYSKPDDAIKPDIVAPGVSIWSLSSEGSSMYESRSGTSMATPHVTGVVALMLSKNPGLTVDEVKAILYESIGGHEGLADDPGDPGKDTRYGWGRLNALRVIENTPYPSRFNWI